MTEVTSAAIARALSAPPPTDEQQRIIEADPRSPLLVVAGAGSGKTETMAMRVLWLVANRHVTPDQVLGLTFTRKAAGELAHRLQTRLRLLQAAGLLPEPEGADTASGSLAVPTVQTYHSYAARLVGEQGLRLGVEPDSELLTEAAAWQLASQVVHSYDGPMDRTGLAASSVTNAVLGLSGEMAEHLLGVDELASYITDFEKHLSSLTGTKRKVVPDKLDDQAAKVRQLLPVVSAYQRAKRERVALDYGDQVAIAAQLAHRFPQLGRSERARFGAVLLDEFQDTSEAQMRLLQSLWVAPGEPVVVTAVGDPNQSIYGWRGASARTLEDFPSRFAATGDDAVARPAAQARLSRSWRNDRGVLEVANLIAAPLRAAGSLEVPQLSPGPSAGPGRVGAGRFASLTEEADRIAAWLKQHRDDADDPTTFSAAVLCRKRSLFVPVAAALDLVGVPYELVGVGGLLTVPEVGDVVSLLWTTHDPSRGDRLMRLLSGSALRLGAADLDALGAWARGQVPRRTGPGDLSRDSAEVASIVEALEQLPPPDWRGPQDESFSPAGRSRLEALAGAVRRLRRLAGLPLADLVVEAINELGLDIEVAARPGYDPGAAGAYLDAFLDVTAQYAGSAGRPTLGGFLEWLEAAEEQEDGLDAPVVQAAPGVVQVLTVHAAKGLEWDHVAVAGLGEGVFPAHLRSAAWSQTWQGWALGKDAVPQDPATWLLSDKGWASGVHVPFDLRGDVGGLPEFAWAEADSFEALAEAFGDFTRAYGDHQLAAERRLAYVALTRARHDLLLTGSVWGTAKTPRLPSRFLLETLRCSAVEVLHWEVDPPADADNPLLSEPRSALWPPAPGGTQAFAAITQAAQRVQQLRTELQQDASGWADWSTRLDPPVRQELAVLQAEWEGRYRRDGAAVAMPGHLSASQIVALARDRQRFARALRRPMPQRPEPAARQGTAFHAWVEQHYQSAALVDLEELPGTDDEDADHDADLAHLKATFLASQWADRRPVAIEVPVETWIGGASIRGRIDAVFERLDAPGVVIVDWKTGGQPHGPEADLRALQLAAYRLAYARLHRLDPGQVEAAFYYAATGVTVYPALPPDDAIEALLANAVEGS